MIAEAIALFARNEAALLAQVSETNKAHAEAQREFVTMKADLEQIKATLRQLVTAVERHEQILNRHERILADLPEAIRQKIGFKTKS